MNGVNNIEVIVIGAGVIGTCSALELIKFGKSVTLIDRKVPGSETSMGNAGILNRGSIIPFNNPTLPKNLPQLISKQFTGFDYQFSYMFNEMNWGLKFLSHCSWEDSRKRAAALNDLISRSAALYGELGLAELLRVGGWLKLFKGPVPSEDSFEITTLNENKVRFEILSKDDINDIEPALKGYHNQALWIKDTASLKDPQKMVRSLASQFEARGGRFVQGEIHSVARENGRWAATLSSGEKLAADTLLIAAGPWSKNLLERLNLYLPMAYERGAHREFEDGPVKLTRPIHDTAGGYVLSPLQGRLRITCGVELADIDAPRNTKQMDAACAEMMNVITPGQRIPKPDWLGARPTLPDNLPAIGACKIPGLWLATGHQHIGMAAAPATGELIAKLITDNKPHFDPTPFAPSRFNL